MSNPPQTAPTAKTQTEKTKEADAHEQVLDAFRAMSLEEQRQTMIDAGILTPDGRLAKEYRRTASDV